MAQFEYQQLKKMTPRPGRRYSTDYYQQTAAQRTATMTWIAQQVARIVAAADQDPAAWSALNQPLPAFRRRETAGCYTALDIMADLLGQLVSGRDIASGLLGRWNRLMASAGLDIEMVPAGTAVKNYKQSGESHAA
jgi:hypothetical protein